jgi:hypothetical protein
VPDSTLRQSVLKSTPYTEAHLCYKIVTSQFLGWAIKESQFKTVTLKFRNLLKQNFTHPEENVFGVHGGAAQIF